jgi:hypothetical protein
MIRSRVVFNDRTIHSSEQQSAQRSRQIRATIINASKVSQLGAGRRPMVETPVEHCSTLVSPSTNSIWLARTWSNAGTLLISVSEKYMRFHCKTTRKNHYVRATICANITDAFIAGRIVRRLGLELQKCATTKKSLVVGRKMVLPTSSFIDVSSCVVSENAQDVYRYHVVEDCTFDILLGPGFSNPLLHWYAKDEKSIPI